jgi:hypothetical protein
VNPSSPAIFLLTFQNLISFNFGFSFCDQLLPVSNCRLSPALLFTSLAPTVSLRLFCSLNLVGDLIVRMSRRPLFVSMIIKGCVIGRAAQNLPSRHPRVSDSGGQRRYRLRDRGSGFFGVNNAPEIYFEFSSPK